MNEQETREKIIKIIAPYVSAYGDDERIANALITAGIGDVKKLQFDNEVLKMRNFFLEGAERSTEEDRQVWISKWEKAEHRAEITEAENAELRARLDKAIELPVKVGDTVWFFDSDRVLKEGKISMLQCKSDGNWKMRITYNLISYKTVFDDYCNKLGIKYFTDRAEAEKKLAELKGEKE